MGGRGDGAFFSHLMYEYDWAGYNARCLFYQYYHTLESLGQVLDIEKSELSHGRV